MADVPCFFPAQRKYYGPFAPPGFFSYCTLGASSGPSSFAWLPRTLVNGLRSFSIGEVVDIVPSHRAFGPEMQAPFSIPLPVYVVDSASQFRS